MLARTAATDGPDGAMATDASWSNESGGTPQALKNKVNKKTQLALATI
jgi:hypothetical protein